MEAMVPARLAMKPMLPSWMKVTGGAVASTRNTADGMKTRNARNRIPAAISVLVRGSGCVIVAVLSMPLGGLAVFTILRIVGLWLPVKFFLEVRLCRFVQPTENREDVFC